MLVAGTVLSVVVAALASSAVAADSGSAPPTLSFCALVGSTCALARVQRSSMTSAIGPLSWMRNPRATYPAVELASLFTPARLPVLSE